MDSDSTPVPTVNLASQASTDRRIVPSAPEESEEFDDLTINFVAEGAD